MKEPSEFETDIDTDSASEDINVEPPAKRRKPTEPNERNDDKKELAEMPKEILAEILIHLDDKSLLKASHVCKSFASAVEMAFARKYSKNHYFIDYNNINDINHTRTKSFDKVMLNKYGGKIQKITIVRGDEEILDLVEQKCCSVKSLKLVDVPKLVMLNQLTELNLDKVHDLNRETFVDFIGMNLQLESLELRGIQANLLEVLDGQLNSLKKFKYIGCTVYSIFPSRIRLKSLQTLNLSLRNAADCIGCLQSMNCNQIKELGLKHRRNPNEDDDHGVLNEICKFETLVSLDLYYYSITLDKMSKLAANLPHLTEFCMGTTVDETELAEKIPSITSMLPEITKLIFRMGKDDFNRFTNELKSSAEDFHARFARNNIEIKLKNSHNIIAITTDHLYFYQEYSVQLHWMNHLNEKNVREVVNSWGYRKELKFVNNCADRTLDISILASWYTKSLDFKSNGPISVKSNFPRYLDNFPNLKTLKIHLEQHSANDFLRALGTDFCERIEKLWLNTKADVEKPDMTNVLAKFSNLKSLHLAPSSIKLNLDHLFAVCQNLTEIKRI